MIEIAAVALLSAAAQHTCLDQLQVMHHVAAEDHLRIGSVADGWVPQTTPARWARQFRSVGLSELARVALAIHDRRSDEAFVLALTSSAAADLAVAEGGSQRNVCVRHF